MPVYFHYAQMMQDAVRVKFPVSMTLEAAPTDAKVNFQDVAQYTLSSTKVANSMTVRRNLIFNGVIVPQKDFGTLRSFYSQLESKARGQLCGAGRRAAGRDEGSDCRGHHGRREAAQDLCSP